MVFIPKAFIKAVVSIGIGGDKTTFNWVGTGFFVVKPVGNNQFMTFMVTNRHVLQGKKKVLIRLEEKNTRKLQTIIMPLEENGCLKYSVHDDEKADIAVMFLDGRILSENNLEIAAFNIEENVLTSPQLIAQGGDEGAYVYMLGFPMGLVNVDSNTPICRGGCIARIEEKEINIQKYFLLDIQNFPGNSGSPIITKPEVFGVGNDPVLRQSVLIGIVSGYIPYKEMLINSQTQEVVEVRSENSGIAVVHPVEFIKEVLDKEITRFQNSLS